MGRAPIGAILGRVADRALIFPERATVLREPYFADDLPPRISAVD